MISLTEKEWRITLAQCASLIRGSGRMSDEAISEAINLMTKCGLSMDVAGAINTTANTVEPPRCPVCREYIWPHEQRTDDKHKRCYDGIALRAQSGSLAR